MIPRANVAKQFLEAPPLAAGQTQLSESTRRMAHNAGDIENFIAFTGGAADEATAIRFLDNSGGRIDDAVNAFLDNPDKYSHGYGGWDESQFSADRGGINAPEAQMGIPSFNIDAGADQGIGANSTAPTRPPSRRSTYSNRSGVQDNGVINAMGQDQAGRTYFGPQQRPDNAYNPAQWAMVTTSSAARVYENADAEDRVRQRDAYGNTNEPVFFKPLKDRDALPSLVAVLAQIPGVRKELLCENLQEEHYGSNTKWWDGEDANAGEASVVGGVLQPQELAQEVQRLVAFTMDTDRSYGSVDALERMPYLSTDTVKQIMEGSRDDATNLPADVRFLVAWTKAADLFGSPSAQHLFKSVFKSEEVMHDSPPEIDESNVYRIELDMNISEPKISMYTAVDRLMWRSDPNGDSEDEYYLDQVAGVLVMRARNRHNTDDASGLGLQVPTTFCADRYLKKNVQATKNMRKARALLRESLGAISEKEAGLNRVPHPKDPEKLLDRQDLFDKTIEFLRLRDKPKDVQKSVKKPETTGDEDASMEDETPRTKWDDVADQLEKQHDIVKNKLKDLDKQRKSLEAQINVLTNIFTENFQAPAAEFTGSPPPLQAQYCLRGIGVGPEYETTFVYVDPQSTSNPDEMEVAGQWWRFDYPSTAAWSQPTKTVVAEEDVLKAASDDAKEALLIYADRRLCDPLNPHNIALEIWPGLQNFIRNDNAAFAAELEEVHRNRYNADQWGVGTEMQEQGQPALPPRPTSRLGDDLPPFYDASTSNGAQHIEHIPDLKTEVEENAWVADPGPSVVSDAEYAANVNYEHAGATAMSGRGVSSLMGSTPRTNQTQRESQIGGEGYDMRSDGAEINEFGQHKDLGFKHW